MVLVWGEKWQMVSWMTVDCVEIDYNMPYPNRNWMWPENQRSNPWRYGICQNKLQWVHVASRCMKFNKEFRILFREYIMTLKKKNKANYKYILFSYLMQQLLSIRGVSCESLDIIVDCFTNIRFSDKPSFPLLIINHITHYIWNIK